MNTGGGEVGAAEGYLINDNLSTVHEIAELCFPQHQLIWCLQRVTHFEAQNSEFGQRRVGNGEGRSISRQVVQWRIPGASQLVVKHSVAMGERATFNILTGQADTARRKVYEREERNRDTNTHTHTGCPPG